jgi:hypothetical protein
MAWSTPPTAVTGVLWTAAQMNTYRDDLNFLNAQPGCRVRRAANQSISSGSTNTITWDTEDQDTDGFIAVSSTTVTIPTGLDGRYLITFATIPASAPANRFIVQITPTGAGLNLPANFRAAGGAGEDRLSVSAAIPLNAADTFACQVFHTNGSAINFTAWMSCYRISA